MGCAVIGDMYVGGGAIVDGDGKPVVIDASGSDDKRVSCRKAASLSRNLQKS